ncbi:helicase-associated domain-containing protein [Nocardioides sp. DS6]|uniref:Helicase-associated domain-containing protein n=1 Tax=Nocardioides eburneus TaxID=3231482 RepID=A0ABV3SVW0_9ACTN
MTSGFRSLADQVRAWSDARLSLLLLARPDLATPAPHDSGQLAARAATRSSLVRALDQLDRCELSVLDALVVAGQTTVEELSSIVSADASAVRAAVARLEDLALAWRSVGGLRALTGVGDAMRGGPGTSGLQPRSAEPLSAAEIEARLAELSPAARALLDHVAEQGGEATTGSARTTITPDQATTPAEELISRRLLVPRSSGAVFLPGEVGIALRGGRTTTTRVDVRPEVPTTARAASLVDRAAAGAAFEVVRRIELLLDGWGATPPAALRSGGLGVRDLKATALRLHVDEPTAALLVEVASAAGLVTTAADADGNPAWLPTDLVDTWVEQSPATRWVTLVRAWLASPRMPGLVGQRDTSGKAWNALVPELADAFMAETRRMTLDVLAAIPEGEVLAAGTGGPAVVARLGWERPRRPRTRAQQVAWTLTEAEALGVTGLGGLASYARPLLAGEDPTPTLAALLPEPVDHVLLQADLTAVAPGPLESHLARQLQLVADVESRGGATVYRFTKASVRRALDRGFTATELHAFLATVSRTPVPQPLSYLVDDTARTFGSVRVGYAAAYLRGDDETTLAELLAHPASESLGLRRLAPTVLVSTLPIDVLLPRLRELGASPVVEDEHGAVHVARPDARRARTPRDRDRRPAGAAEARETARVAAVVSSIRAGDRAHAERPATAPAVTPGSSLAVLREAVDAGRSVTITYLDSRGVPTDRVVEPLSVEGGQLTARDRAADGVLTFSVPRIRSVRAL